MGNLAKVEAGTPKFLARTAGGVWLSQSPALKVPNSEKSMTPANRSSRSLEKSKLISSYITAENPTRSKATATRKNEQRRLAKVIRPPPSAHRRANNPGSGGSGSAGDPASPFCVGVP